MANLLRVVVAVCLAACGSDAAVRDLHEETDCTDPFPPLPRCEVGCVPFPDTTAGSCEASNPSDQFTAQCLEIGIVDGVRGCCMGSTTDGVMRFWECQ